MPPKKAAAPTTAATTTTITGHFAFICFLSTSFVSERLYGAESGGTSGRVEAEDDPYESGNSEGHHHREKRDAGREADEGLESMGEEPSEDHSDHAAHEREQHGLG